MIKRLLCFFMVFTMLSFPCIYAEANDSTQNIQSDVTMLRAFGILDGGIGSPDSTMKRGDFFKIIGNMINLKSTEELVSAKVLSGVGNGDLGENETLTYTQAITLLVRVLGYSDIAERSGGYPDGYIQVASDIGITKDVSVQDELKKSEIIKLICNACDTEILQLIELGANGNSYSPVDGETLLVYYHDIYRLRGIVSEVKDICINREKGNKTDCVVIAGTYMEADGVDAEPYLGMNVDGYYRQVDSDDPVLVHITPLSKNEVITISADDIVREETTKEELVYSTEDSGRNKRIKISPVADMVYNRRGYVNYKAEDFMPEVGEVKLIDNDGDGIYDCIIVTEYQTVLVDRVSAVSDEIFSEYGKSSINLSVIDDYIIHNTSGEEMNVSEIASGNVLFVKMSKNEEYAEITVSQNTVTGSASVSDASEKTLEIDGVVYKINSQMYDYYEATSKDIMAIGKNRTYYLDPEGRIAGYAVANIQEHIYGFLYKRYLDEAGDKLYMIILDEEGQWNTYEAADRFTIDDANIRTHSVALEKLSEHQVIRLKLDEDSNVKRIETATEIPDGEDTEYFNKITFTKVYRSPNASFNSEFYLDGNMIIFQIPTGIDEETGEKYADNRSNYSVTGNEFEDYANYTVTLYDVDRNNRTRIVSYEKNGGEKTLGNTVFLVDKIGHSVKGEEIFQTASGIVVGQELSVTANDEELFNGLKRGDLIRFHINDEGRVDAVGVVQKAGDEWLDEDVLTNTLASSTPAILKGTIVHIDAEEGYIKIQGTTGTRALKISEAKIALYEKDDDEVKAASSADIQIGDFAVVLASSSVIKSVTLYR